MPISMQTQRNETRATMRPRLGFLGVGWIGLNRMQSIAGNQDIEIAAIADGSPDARNRAAESAPQAVPCETLEELLNESVDGIVIATPSALHAEQACQCLSAGKAVFCQKPLARTREEVQRVIATAKAADRLLGVDLSYRFVNGVAQMRELVQSGELGTVYAANLVFHNAYGPDKPWFYDARQSGGGCLIDLGTHLVDFAQWILGDHSICAISSRLFQQGQRLTAEQVATGAVEDYAQVNWDTNTGAAVNLACSWRLSAGCDAVIEAAFFGSQRAVRLRNVNGSFYDFQVERMTGTQCTAIATPPDDWGGRCLADWCSQLAAGQRYDNSIESLLQVSQILDTSYGRSQADSSAPTLIQ